MGKACHKTKVAYSEAWRWVGGDKSPSKAAQGGGVEGGGGRVHVAFLFVHAAFLFVHARKSCRFPARTLCSKGLAVSVVLLDFLNHSSYPTYMRIKTMYHYGLFVYVLRVQKPQN